MSFRSAVIACLGSLLAAMPAAAADAYHIHSFERIELSKTFFSEGATHGDLDRDGDQDLISGPYWYEGPSFEKRHEYYPTRPFDPKGYSDNFFAFVEDFDGDGWNDILIYGFPGKDASWFRNPQGKEGHWTRHIVFDAVDNESPDWKDVTGDGRPEIICHTGGRFGYAQPDWNAPAKKWQFTPISEKLPIGRFNHGLGVGDVNGDGRTDFLWKSGWFEQPASLPCGSTTRFASPVRAARR